MINHARTLLMNVPSLEYFPDTLGEELVPPLYEPVVLPGSLRNVRRLLFGSTPDRHMLNYRCRQLLGLVHSCELAEFVTDLDPRVTYDFADEPYFDPLLFRATAESLVVPSGASAEIYLFGHADLPDRSGLMHRTWTIEIIDADTLEIRQPGNHFPVSQEYTVSGGLSSRQTIPGTNFSFQFRDSVFTPSQGPQFRVESLARPQTSLGSLMASVGLLGDETLAALFGITTPAGRQEPLQTFRRLYENHYSVAHRLGAVALALIYQTEALRIA
jgi:hypothetical protein